MALSRADNSILGRWWWTVDRWTLAALMVLIGFGYVLMLAASPAVAERIGASSRHMFFLKQVFYLALAAAVMVAARISPRRDRGQGWARTMDRKGRAFRATKETAWRPAAVSPAARS